MWTDKAVHRTSPPPPRGGINIAAARTASSPGGARCGLRLMRPLIGAVPRFHLLCDQCCVRCLPVTDGLSAVGVTPAAGAMRWEIGVSSSTGTGGVNGSRGTGAPHSPAGGVGSFAEMLFL